VAKPVLRWTPNESTSWSLLTAGPAGCAPELCNSDVYKNAACDSICRCLQADSYLKSGPVPSPVLAASGAPGVVGREGGPPPQGSPPRQLPGGQSLLAALQGNGTPHSGSGSSVKVTVLARGCRGMCCQGEES